PGRPLSSSSPRGSNWTPEPAHQNMTGISSEPAFRDRRDCYRHDRGTDRDDFLTPLASTYLDRRRRGGRTDMTDDPLRPIIQGTYVALAALLESMPLAQWDTPSLCEGWRVREVVAHLTMPARYSDEAFMAELGEDAFDFTRLSNRIASRDSQ